MVEECLEELDEIEKALISVVRRYKKEMAEDEYITLIAQHYPSEEDGRIHIQITLDFATSYQVKKRESNKREAKGYYI